MAKLQFGRPAVGTLRVPAHIANRLASAVLGRWPEPGPFDPESRGETFRRRFIEWALITGIAATFFIVTPRIVAQMRHGRQSPSRSCFQPLFQASLPSSVLFATER
jgi:hypothetical protein